MAPIGKAANSASTKYLLAGDPQKLPKKEMRLVQNAPVLQPPRPTEVSVAPNLSSPEVDARVVKYVDDLIGELKGRPRDVVVMTDILSMLAKQQLGPKGHQAFLRLQETLAATVDALHQRQVAQSNDQVVQEMLPGEQKEEPLSEQLGFLGAQSTENCLQLAQKALESGDENRLLITAEALAALKVVTAPKLTAEQSARASRLEAMLGQQSASRQARDLDLAKDFAKLPAGAPTKIARTPIKAPYTIEVQHDVWDGGVFYPSLPVVRFGEKLIPVYPPDDPSTANTYPSTKAIADTLATLPDDWRPDSVELATAEAPTDVAGIDLDPRGKPYLYVLPATDGKMQTSQRQVLQSAATNWARGKLGSAGDAWVMAADSHDGRGTSWNMAAMGDGPLEGKKYASPAEDLGAFAAALREAKSQEELSKVSPRRALAYQRLQSARFGVDAAPPSWLPLPYNVVAPKVLAGASAPFSVKDLGEKNGSIHHLLEIDGRSIPFNETQSNTPTVAGDRMAQAARVFSKLPRLVRDQVTTIKVAATGTGVAGATTSTTANCNALGEMTLFPEEAPFARPDPEVYRSMLHETGHVVSARVFGSGEHDETWSWDGNGPGWDRWAVAAKADRSNPSEYGMTSPSEDFSESWALYWIAKGEGPTAFDEARRQMPSRFQLIDEIVKHDAKSSYELPTDPDPEQRP